MRQELREWVEELACRAGLDGLPRSVRPAALFLAVGALGLAVWWWGAPAGGAGAAAVRPKVVGVAKLDRPEATAPSVPASITVHVVGAVMREGVYTLPAGSRVAQAVAAAGGLLGNADQSGVNLARVVEDGEQVVVPAEGEAPPAGGAQSPRGTPGASGAGPIDLNTASVTELDSLPGVGPVTAAKIVADRGENGPFRRAEDLMRVPGIGPKRFESLKDLVTVR